MATMRAVRLHAFGGPDVLKIEETPRPEPKSGEVLIRVHGAGVNPVDWKIREGYTNHKLPLVPGWDVAGVIEKVGPEVTSLKPKDEVYGYFDLSRNGAYADYVAVPAEEVALKPKSLDFTKAAAVPLAALTAWQGLFDVGGLKPGQKVLIHAAAGGVGSFAVQFAKWKGAHVIGTASGRNVQFVRELGADEVIDYTKTAFEEAVDNVDLVFDTMGGETQKRSWQVLKKGRHSRFDSRPAPTKGRRCVGRPPGLLRRKTRCGGARPDRGLDRFGRRETRSGDCLASFRCTKGAGVESNRPHPREDRA
jgi:NADPH:quinone reductase-like Zn-dependent oxidoreductase